MILALGIALFIVALLLMNFRNSGGRERAFRIFDFLSRAGIPRSPVHVTCDACQKDGDPIGFSEVNVDLNLVEWDGTEIILPLKLTFCNNCFHA